MTRTEGDRSSFVALLRALGAWLHPVSAFRRRSEPERQLQLRVGIAGVFIGGTGLLALGVSLWWLTVVRPSISGVAALWATVALVAISVFAPQAVFRARNSAMTKQVLSNPSSPIRPWRSTTITFDAVLVGAMLAGIYFDPALTLACFVLAFSVRVVFQSRRTIEVDANARFHSAMVAWTSAATAAAAFAIVKPLATNVSTQGSIVPLILAAVVAMYIGLAFNAAERWLNGDRTRWAFARDAVDTRRIVVALISAGIAWLVAVVGDAVAHAASRQDAAAGSAAALAVFLASWLVLWFASIRMWRHDAAHTLDLWSAHQAEIVTRLTDGSLSPELAGRAALPITTRMAISVFGATRAMTIVDDGRGHVTRHLVAVDVYDNAPAIEPRLLASVPHLTMPLYALPGHANTSGVTVAGWLWTGSFMTRSASIVQRFTELATAAVLTPVVAANDDRNTAAFELMFDDVNRWPTLAAFEEAVDRMRRRSDQNPHTDSLLIGVYAIDDFGALAGGRFEQAAVAQVLRLALGHQDFAGHDLFAAYEAPGRLWVALGGGPIIRNGIELLRGLQQHINDHGAVPSARLDVDVHVSVSFGYAAHQVDDFSREGLMAMALSRLSSDQSARNPFAIDDLMGYDISPEDIIGQPDLPVTAVDVMHLLVADHRMPTTASFTTQFTPITQVDSGATDAVWAQIGWERSFGTLDLSSPANFLALVNRQPQLAAQATRIILDRLRVVFAEADALGHDDLPVIVSLPPILLHPDAGDLSLPQLVTSFLDARECARTVILVDTVPAGGGRALRLLSERGLQIAVTSPAAAGAEPSDLFGWLRWGVFFPQHVVNGASGIDGLTIQQTTSAIATQQTRLIAVTDQWIDPRDLAEHNIGWTLDSSQFHESVRECVDFTSSPRR